MLRVHHGMQSSQVAPTIEDALTIARNMLELGYVNVLISREDAVVTGRTAGVGGYEDGRIATLVLEIGVM